MKKINRVLLLATAFYCAGASASPNATVEIPKHHPVVYFDFDRAVVKTEYFPLLEKQASYLKRHPGLILVMAGNTDERHSREYNLAIGQRRAEAVLHQMILLGVPQDRLDAISFGSEHPAVKGHNEAAWAMNRRVDLFYRKSNSSGVTQKP